VIVFWVAGWHYLDASIVAWGYTPEGHLIERSISPAGVISIRHLTTQQLKLHPFPHLELKS